MFKLVCSLPIRRSLSSQLCASTRLSSTVSPADFHSALTDAGIKAYFGVPDSLLKDFNGYITDHTPTENHIVAANEGTAVGLAAGWYMGNATPACVYLQNSGLGNIVNPIMSLAHQKVYGTPLLLVIGWRGEPGVKDEPQHTFMGAQTQEVLDSMKVKYAVMPTDAEEARELIKDAAVYMEKEQAPFAILVRKGTFTKYKPSKPFVEDIYPLKREQAIQAVAKGVGEDVAIVSATGMPSRELYEYRVAEHGVEGATGRDFLTVGSMGCCSSIAHGLALGSKKEVVCLDGDGGTIMHLGALVTNGVKAPTNFKHVILNNAAHDSVGGMPSYAFDSDLPGMAAAAGYKATRSVSTLAEIAEGCKWLRSTEGPALLEVRIRTGVRSDIGRPKSTPAENKTGFMRHVAGL